MKRATVVLACTGWLMVSASTAVAHAQRPDPDRDRPSDRSRSGHRDARPNARVWLSGDNVLRRGERARAYFRADDDAYVMIVRIDTDGRLRVLYPETPSDEGLARRGVTYDVAERGHDGIYADDYPGMGYIFAIASWDPFDFNAISYSRSWDYRRIGDRIHRDPFQAMDEFAHRVLYDRTAQYSLNYAEYYVERRYDYPRFVCYDCHTYRSYASWDPYRHFCSHFRLVVYVNPFNYNPYPYYRGSRVVYATPQPRYEFKQVAAGARVTPENFIERRQRTDGDDQRRPGSPESDPNLTGRRAGEGPATVSPRTYDVDGRGSAQRRGETVDDQSRGTSSAIDRSPRRQPAPEQHDDSRSPPRVDPRSEPAAGSRRAEPRSEPRPEPRSEPRESPRPTERYDPPAARRSPPPSASPRQDGGGSRPSAPPPVRAPQAGAGGMPTRRP